MLLALDKTSLFKTYLYFIAIVLGVNLQDIRVNGYQPLRLPGSYQRTSKQHTIYHQAGYSHSTTWKFQNNILECNCPEGKQLFISVLQSDEETTPFLREALSEWLFISGCDGVLRLKLLGMKQISGDPDIAHLSVLK